MRASHSDEQRQQKNAIEKAFFYSYNKMKNFDNFFKKLTDLIITICNNRRANALISLNQ